MFSHIVEPNYHLISLHFCNRLSKCRSPIWKEVEHCAYFILVRGRQLFGRWAELAWCSLPGWRCLLTTGSCCRYFWRSPWIFQPLLKDSCWQLSRWVLWSKAALLQADGSHPRVDASSCLHICTGMHSCYASPGRTGIDHVALKVDT